MQIDSVSHAPMLAAMMHTGGSQSGSAAQSASAALNKTDGDGDAQKGAMAVNDHDADDHGAAQKPQSTSGIDIKV